jgi:hypothetical protein
MVQLRRASAGRVGLKRSKDRIEAQRTAFAAGIRLSGPRLGLDTGQNTWPYSTDGAYLNRIVAKPTENKRPAPARGSRVPSRDHTHCQFWPHKANSHGIARMDEM